MADACQLCADRLEGRPVLDLGIEPSVPKAAGLQPAWYSSTCPAWPGQAYLYSSPGGRVPAYYPIAARRG